MLEINSKLEIEYAEGMNCEDCKECPAVMRITSYRVGNEAYSIDLCNFHATEWIRFVGWKEKTP